MKRSIVEYYAEHESYKCGYCKSPDTNFSHGMWAHTLTVSDYQDLIDRGWRRSGKYCYKPSMDVTCCPMYTIRCQALEFKATKSQKKLLKRFNKYLVGQDMELRAGDGARKMSTCSSGDEEVGGDGGEQFEEPSKQHQDIDITDVKLQDESEHFEKENVDKGETSAATDVVAKIQSKQENKEYDPTKAPSKKAKLLRRERRLEKLKEKGVHVSTVSDSKKNKEKQLEDFINEVPNEYKQNLEIKLVRTAPPSKEYLATMKETHEVYVKYQVKIHEDPPQKCTESKFADFLVSSPLLEEYSEMGPSCGYGSFHQQYWLKGKLIAVGVIDILPKCVSSVYFFYDPQYMNLTLGTYGALREIAFTRQLHQVAPELRYYYMGFYIHSCRKMRYKGNFYPSDLLCPETYKWFPLKDCIPKLEVSPYSRLDSDIDSVDENYPNDSDVNYIPIFTKGTVMLYKMFKRKFAKNKDDSELVEYSRLVGAKTAKSLVLVR